MITSASPEPDGPWWRRHTTGGGRILLERGRRELLLRMGGDQVASTSMINGAPASMPAFGAWSPGEPHTLARAAFQARPMAFSAASASAPRTAISRETVASEATDP